MLVQFEIQVLLISWVLDQKYPSRQAARQKKNKRKIKKSYAFYQFLYSDISEGLNNKKEKEIRIDKNINRT